MLEARNIASLLEKCLNGDATPEEVEQLGGWASLNEKWVESRVKIYHEPDLAENLKELYSRIDARQAKKQIRRAHVRTFMQFSAAAILIGVIIAITVYFVGPKKTMIALDGNKKIAQTIVSPNPQAINWRPAPSENVKDLSSKEIVNNYGYKVSQTSSVDQRDVQMLPWVSTPLNGFMEKEPLPDGSSYWLNSSSFIRFPNSFDGSRKVEVIGEAYFQVKPDKVRPFWVFVNRIKVLSTGGSFNINAYAEEGITKITALEGTLYIGKDTLYSGQRAEFMGKSLIRIIPADVAKVSAWTKKRFAFENDSSNYVVRELARWYGLILMGNVKDWPQTLLTYKGSRGNEIEEVVSEIMKQNPGKINLKIVGKNLEIR